MEQNMAFIGLMIRTAWGALGAILGVIALIRLWIKLRRQKQQVTLNAKFMGGMQIILTPLAALFVLWLLLSLNGIPIRLGWQVWLALVAGSFVAFPNAFWLLVEVSCDHCNGSGLEPKA
jgi:ABC-type xylose transport system permease subunit